MLNLISKDFKFTKKQALILIAYCIAVPILLYSDSGTNYYMASVFIPFVATSLLVNKICAIEDTTDMLIMLKRLPCKNTVRVAARFIFAFIVLAFSQLYLTCIQTFIFRLGSFSTLIIDNILLFLGFSVYYGLYLTLYYWQGSHFAQYSVYVCLGVYFAISFFVNRMEEGERFFEFMQNFLQNRNTFSLACLGIIFLFYFLSLKGEEHRKLV